jgi:hypothetical protein
MTAGFVLYFGCWDQAGHFLWEPNHQHMRDFDADRLLIPRGRDLDASLVFLPKPEKVACGAVTYLPANDRTVLAWWGSPWDNRGAVNSAIIVSGKASAEDCWQRFDATFPALARQLKMPTTIEGRSLL